MKEINTTLKSVRNTDIPTTIFDCEKDKAPLIIFVHGFKANRFEDYRFNQVAHELDCYGITVGFPGCDESKEDFINYSLDSCLEEIELEYKYMLEHYSIDTDHLGLLGYSMGGRLISIFSNRHPEFKTMAFWAGATYDQKEYPKFLGPVYEDMAKEANEKGFYHYYNSFDGDYINLSKQLIDNMVEYTPCELLKPFTGAAIVVHGDKDDTVEPEVGLKTYNALENARVRKRVVVKDANHGFGQWDNHPEQSKQLVDCTSEFFKENL